MPAYTVTDTNSLNAAIAAANADTSSQSFTFTFANDVTLDAALTPLNLHSGTSLSVLGAGHVLSGADTFRGLQVGDASSSKADVAANAAAVAVSVADLTFSHLVATGAAGTPGSAGAAGGAGGAAQGGALDVVGNVVVTLSDVSFDHDVARGGAGGAPGGAGGDASGGAIYVGYTTYEYGNNEGEGSVFGTVIWESGGEATSSAVGGAGGAGVAGTAVGATGKGGPAGVYSPMSGYQGLFLQPGAGVTMTLADSVGPEFDVEGAPTSRVVLGAAGNFGAELGGGVLELSAAAAASGSAVSFERGAQTLQLDGQSPTGTSGVTLLAPDLGDVIDIRGIGFQPNYTASGGAMQLSSGATPGYTLKVYNAGSLAGDLTLSDDGAGGTRITVSQSPTGYGSTAPILGQTQYRTDVTTGGAAPRSAAAPGFEGSSFLTAAVDNPYPSDPGVLTQVKVQITGGYHAGEDVLGLSQPVPGVTTSFDTATGTLTLTSDGTGAPAQDSVAKALGLVSYTDTAATPSTSERTLTVTATSMGGTSAPLTHTIDLVPPVTTHFTFAGPNYDTGNTTIVSDFGDFAVAPNAAYTVFGGEEGGVGVYYVANGTTTTVLQDDSIPLGFSPDSSKILLEAFDPQTPGAPADHTEYYLYTLATGTFALVSSNAAGVAANGGSGTYENGSDNDQRATISADGNHVAFDGNATNLLPTAPLDEEAVYVKTLSTGALALASANALGMEANADSYHGSVSGDGSLVAFVSAATNLAPGGSGQQDIFVKNLTTGAVTLASSSAAGVEGNGASDAPQISPDGTRVVFESDASNLVSGDANGGSDVFLKDLRTGAVTLVSSDSSGVQLPGVSSDAVFTADGTSVVFVDAYLADPTAAGAGFDDRLYGGDGDIYVKNLTTGVLTRVTAGVGATNTNPTVADDGTIGFQSNNQLTADGPSSEGLYLATGYLAATSSGNTPPAIAGTVAGQADTAGVAIHPFAAVTITDPDAGQAETVTVTLSAAANGALAGGGFTQTAPGVYSVTEPVGAAGASAAAAQAALRAAVFTPTAGQSATTTFTVAVSDGSTTATDPTTSVVATYTPPAAGGGGAPGTGYMQPLADPLPVEFQNLERALIFGADASTTGSPIYAAVQTFRTLDAQYVAGQVTLAQAEATLAHLVDGTTAVAVASYGFFTGATPTAAGLNYLVHSQANATDLNDAYYARFSTENRYINFAVNLATGPGAGASAFAASYGSLSLADATAKAYAAVFGAPADATKVSALLDTLVPDGLGGEETRAAYFAQYGGDGPNGQGTKAAMVGFLLANAVETGAGVYGAATEHYLSALAHGQAPAFGSELALTYGANVNLVGFTPVPDPTVTT